MTRIVFAFALCSFVAGGCGSNAVDPKGGAGARGLAVVVSDGMGTAAVSLVDAKSATVSHDDCIDSRRSDPALLVPLSDDLVLPSMPSPDHALIVIDRTNATLTWVSPADCSVTRQLSVSSGFAAAPHDLVVVDAHKAYVSRFNANPAPSLDPLLDDRGNDLLVIDPSSGSITKRIDLSNEATNVTGATILARPDRMLLVGGKLYVTLGELADDGLATGPARVLQIDPATDSIANAIDLPTFKSCSDVDYLAATNLLVVGCRGDVNETYANRVAQAGIALLSLGVTPPSIKTTVGSSSAGGQLLGTMAVSGDDAVFGATIGDSSPGALWSFQLDDAAAGQVIAGSIADGFGGIAWDAGRQRVYVSDFGSAAPVVRLFDTSDQLHVKIAGSFVADPALGLAPVHIGWY